MRRPTLPCMSLNMRADITMEIKMMVADLIPGCPVGSPDFNASAIAWIEKNAARFRKKWEQCHNGKKEFVVSN